MGAGCDQEGCRDDALKEGVAEAPVGPAGMGRHPGPLPAAVAAAWDQPNVRIS
jgi:hypothetical protein